MQHEQIIGGKTKRKKALEKPKYRWVGKDNIKADLGEIGWGGMDKIDVAQDRAGGSLY